ncbi:unnamed protein product, partial [Trypanosoma congolense IL3000]
MVVVSEVPSVVTFLSETGEHYRYRTELLRQRFLEKERQECTFRPKLSRYAARKKAVAESGVCQPVEKRLLELHARQKELAELRRVEHSERERARLEMEIRPPRLTSRARSLTRRDQVEISRAWLKKREDNVARMREAILQEDLDAMRPATSFPSRAHVRNGGARRDGPRIEDHLIAEREARRQRMYERYERAMTMSSGSDCSLCSENPRRLFRPHITRYARSMSLTGDVVDRLLSRDKGSRRKSRDVDLTGVPRVSSSSTRHFRYLYKNPNMSVHDRLYHNDYIKRCEPGAMRNSCDVRSEHVGVPQINETSRAIVERRRAEELLLYGGCRSGSPTSRLHAGRGVTVSATRHKLHCENTFKEQQEEESAHCTFRPSVDEWSEQIWQRQVQRLRLDGNSQSGQMLLELLWRRSETRAKEDLQRQRELNEQKEFEECTFHPKVGRAPRSRVVCGLSVHERNEAWAQRRVQRLDRTRQEIERRELAECSFHPSITVLPSSGPTAFSGRENSGLHTRKSFDLQSGGEWSDEWWNRGPRSSHGDNSDSPLCSEPLQQSGLS